MPPAPPVPQEPASALSSPPPADVSTFLAFPSPEKLLRLGPKSSVLIAQQVTAPRPQTSVPRLSAGWGRAAGDSLVIRRCVDERVRPCGHTWAPGRTGLPLLRRLELAFSLTCTHIPRLPSMCSVGPAASRTAVSCQGPCGRHMRTAGRLPLLQPHSFAG